MGDEQAPKKISFGFSKQIKKSAIIVPNKPVEEKVQFIDCLEGKSIKLRDGEEIEEKKPLVIPLKEKDRTSTAAVLARIAKEVETDLHDPPACESDNSVAPQPVVVENESLEARAARELLEEARHVKVKEPENSTLVVPLAEQVKIVGEKESTLDDYENIPIGDFGMAMLRGMGWKEGKGIGKSCKNVDVVLPKMRPKGMGLGADKVAIATTNNEKSNGASNAEELKIIKGAFIKIVAGKQTGTYGQISGFDEDSGRVIVKTAIGGANINVNEFMVQAVSKDEYTKQSKVINADKYEEYKRKEISSSRENPQKRSESVKEEKRRDPVSDYSSDNSEKYVREKPRSNVKHERGDVQEQRRKRDTNESSDDDSKRYKNESNRKEDCKNERREIHVSRKRDNRTDAEERRKKRDTSDSSDDDPQQYRNQSRHSRKDDYRNDKRENYDHRKKYVDYEKRNSSNYERSKDRGNSTNYYDRKQEQKVQNSSSDDSGDDQRRDDRKYEKKKHRRDSGSDDAGSDRKRSPVAKWRESDKKRKGKKRRRDKSRSRDRRRK